MPTEVILPRVDMDMTDGRISRWHVAEGETVEKGQPIFEIETDKAAMEVEAPASGVIRGLEQRLDTKLPVGATVAWIEAPGEAADAAPRGWTSETSPRMRGEVERAAKPRREGEGQGELAPTPVPHHPAPHPHPLPTGGEREHAPRATEEVTDTGGSAMLRATPLARRLARERGVDLAGLAGSGPRGRVQAHDVEAPVERELASTTDADAVPSPLNAVWLRRGQGTPLVLLHGFGADLNAWRAFLAVARPSYPVLGIDLPGHGGSAGATVASFDEMMAAVAETVRAEVRGPLHLAGHSLGGAVAASLAARGDIEARSLTLLAPAGLGAEIDGAFIAGFLRARGGASLKPWLDRLTVDPAALGPAFLAATLRQRQDEASLAAMRAIADAVFPDGTQAFDTRPALAGLTVPLKVVFGAQDRVIPARHAQGLPGTVAVHIFPRIGHMPQVEAAPAVARLLAEAMRAAG